MQQLRSRRKAGKADIKADNRRLVLQAISDGGASVSRADLTRSTGLTTGTISSVVGELLDEGLVAEVGFGPSVGGKPPILLDIASETVCVVAFELGPDTLRAAAVDLHGRVLAVTRDRLTSLEPDSVVAQLAHCLSVLDLDRRQRVAGAAVAVPGLVREDGFVRRSVPMGWVDVDLGRLLATSMPVRTVVVNDSDAAAIAESTRGGGGPASLMALYVGAGVGAGLVLSGALFTGDHVGAGEVGHVDLRTHTHACRCGHRGCLEAVAGVPILLGSAADSTSWFANPVPMPCDPRSLDEAATGVVALMELVHGLLDLERTVLCGPVVALGSDLVERVSARLASRAHPGADPLVVVESSFGTDSALLGAAAYASHRCVGFVWSAPSAPQTTA